MKLVRQALERQVRRLVGSADDDPAAGGDIGLFGPDAVCWKVHGDFTTMMVGGVTALLMQMLHPAALAGVWDHSNFRDDMTGRLRGTARFIAGATYGSTQDAAALIARVRAIHDHVHGRLPDGTAYDANDPALLTWVHAAEASSFLKAYRRHRDPAMSPADQDRYYDEVAVIAERLGAVDVPRSKAASEAYLQAMRPALRYDDRTREVARVLLTYRAPNPVMTPFAALVFGAAQDLLPDWAAQMHGFPASARRRPALKLGVAGVGSIMRWALQNGAETRARRRAAALAG